MGSFYFCKVSVEKMSIEDAKDSVDGYEGHDEEGDPNVSIVEEGDVTEINHFKIILDEDSVLLAPTATGALIVIVCF